MRAISITSNLTTEPLGKETYRQTMHNDRPDALLDDVRQNAERRRNTLIPTRDANGSIAVDTAARTRLPLDVRRMDCLLHVRATR